MARAVAPLLVGLAALTTYWLTLYPGVGGGGDAVKFQYIGSVLGTPHPPGYPLYTLVSYLFSFLPIGTLAYRMNLLSALCGAGASALLCLTLLRLRCHPLVAIAAGLALAFDRLLWAKSVGAEVYALNAALIALILWFGVRWSETRRDRDLYLMVGAFALSLGHHLTVVSLVPALMAFVLVTRARSISVRTVATSAAIVALGLAQYGFIVLRTYQQAPLLEARASTLGELVEVMRASRFSDQIFAFSAGELIQERVPQFWNVFVTEFTPLGLALIVIGGLWAIVRRSAAGMLFAAGAAGIVVLTMNVGADVEGFLVAACVPAWALAGLGLQAVRDAIRRLPRPAAALLGAAVVAALPIWQLSRNYAANDHHRRTYEDRYLRAMFAVLESRAAIVREAYSVDQLVLYKLAGERAAGERSIVMIPLDRAEVARHVKAGAVVYAFSTARSTLETRGITFEPVALRDPVGSGDAEIDMTPLPLYRVVSASECADIGNTGWRDVTDVARDGSLMIRIDNYRPFEATVSILAGVEPGAGAPELVIAQGPVRPTLSWTSASRPYDWPPAVQSAGLPNVARADLRVNDRGDFSIAWLRWPSPPSRVWARAVVDLDNPRRAVLCNWSRADFFHASRTASVPLAEQGDPFFGQGWQAPEAMNEGGHMRRTAGAYAEILVPLPEPRAIRVRLHARALGTVERHPISIRINGHRMAVKPMAHVWTTFEWDVPAGMWRDGLNRLTVESGDPAFDVGLALSQLTFELLD